MKQIKDPIYGYVDIDDIYIQLINTPEFRRLRNIVQTSYQALYPSALHNRFVHSIGVFHLGEKAFSCFKRNVLDAFAEYACCDWEGMEKTFLMACLLHDVGHSPFSHTGESFYKNDFKMEISDLLQDEDLKKDISAGTGKPHEAMSAIVGLMLLKRLGISKMINENLFIRSIIGVQYTSEEHLIENIIIGMLNGTLIDVDKLDYLIRDGYVTGFSTMALDVDRLFAGYTIVDYVDPSASKHRVAAYKRGALSVIENVTFANDLERHWIQNNPAILYDAKLVDLAISHYNIFMKKKYSNILIEKTVFTEKALSYDGYLEQGVPLCLLSDDDIIAYLKNEIHDTKEVKELRKQYFARDMRLKPLWKSETEFLQLEQDLIGSSIRRSFKATLKAISKTVFFMNDDEMKKANEQKRLMEEAENSNNEVLKEAVKTSLPAQNLIIQTFQIFNMFVGEYKLDFEFAFIFVEHHYESNYSKLQNSDIYIEFAPNRVIPLREALAVTSVLPTDDEKNGYYYLFSSKHNIDKMKEQGLDLGQEIMKYISCNWKL